MKRRLSSLLKVGITMVGLLLVFRQIEFAALARQFAHINQRWLALAALLMIGSLPLRAVRWAVLLRGLETRVDFGRLIALYFIGNFFNSFLPSGFGGDAVRVLEAAKDVPASIAAGTVIIDRLTGLMMLFVMALVALVVQPAVLRGDVAGAIVALSTVGLLAGSVLLDGRLPQWLLHQLPRARWPKVAQRGFDMLDNTVAAIRGCGQVAIWQALAISLLFNGLLVGWWFAAGRALGLTVSYAYQLVVVPVLSLALLVPSIGGLGVRETLAPALFAGANLSADEAVALSLLVFALLRLTSLLGAPLYLAAQWRARLSAE